MKVWISVSSLASCWPGNIFFPQTSSSVMASSANNVHWTDKSCVLGFFVICQASVTEWTWLIFISTQAQQVAIQMFTDNTQTMSIVAICNITSFGNCLKIHACLQWYPYCQSCSLSSSLKCLSELLSAVSITGTLTD